MQIVTTTGIIADLVRSIGWEARQRHLTGAGKRRPTSYEPSLRDIRNIVYARDVAFSNYLMLEEQNLIKSLDANLRDGVPNIALARMLSNTPPK